MSGWHASLGRPGLESQFKFGSTLRLRFRPQPGREEVLRFAPGLTKQLHQVVGHRREPNIDPLMDEQGTVDLFIGDPVG